MSDACEVNFDGIVGPTHNYAGLSPGNIASTTNRSTTSNPREAALQGLAKMRRLIELGLPQAVLPPHDRPSVSTLRRLGFSGTDTHVLESAAREAPELLAAAASASAMWAANAATVAPSSDTVDGRAHLTPANLTSNLHRSLEAPQTGRILRAIFHSEGHFVVHDPLPAHTSLGDEGAANHTRLCRTHAAAGIHLFVHGRSADANAAGPQRFPARQTLAASIAVARLNALAPASVVHFRQSSKAIDAGVFHNDVIAVGNERVLLCHEQAFDGQTASLDLLRDRFARHAGHPLTVLTVPAGAVPLTAAVSSYLFNSQLVTLPDGSMALIAPAECREHAGVSAWLDALTADTTQPIRRVEALDLRQSMRNGGGPACLRLRVVLTAAERDTLPAGILVDTAQLDRLAAWVKRHYRDRLEAADLADPQLLEESRRALDELTALLGTGPLYDFQR